MPRILFIENITHEAVGGKAEGLNQLIRWGLSVPRAFVISDIVSTDVVVKSSVSTNVTKTKKAAGTADWLKNLSQAYAEIGAGNVAVRSSAIGEDGADASFAGQYETILNVDGIDALKAAIAQCVASLDGARAKAYQNEKANASDVRMCVVVQQMVDAHAAGVLFTADPVSGRHDRIVIDAVLGLGEALVSGEKTPDHYEIDARNSVVTRDLVAAEPVLTDAQLQQMAKQARHAQTVAGSLLDMEWAIDKSGALHWLQARPITTLGADLNELDTPIPAGHVITRCNVGEMMPGAVCPLTFDVQGRAIEHGMQHMHVEYGGRPAITQDWTQINQFFGHLFINLSGSLECARYVSINSKENMTQSLCGRPVPELNDPANPAPRWRRWWGSLQMMRYCFRAPSVVTEFESRFRHFHVEYFDNSRDMMTEMERKFPWLCETNEVHLRSSAGSGVMEGILQGIVSKGQNPPTAEQQAEAARLLAGASYVESAMLVDHLDEVVGAISRHPQALARFKDVDVERAHAWLTNADSGAAGRAFTDFLFHHGHRSYRELCVREKAWIDEPHKLVATMQASLAGRFLPGYQKKQHAKINWMELPRLTRIALRLAHGSVRRREHTKSILVMATHRLKRGYRHLGELLVAEGQLPDADLIFFFTRRELREFVDKPTVEKVAHAKARRAALSFHEKLEFDDISVGKPEPVVWKPIAGESENELVGRPVSRGVVEGKARVALTIEEATSLQPGEILVAPITDVGWTPYFSLISGLATDVGSAVSHGAVIAREYGLPCIVNLRTATRRIKTGDTIRLDADKGLLTILGK
jgi:rifampicin phosphotransferase